MRTAVFPHGVEPMLSESGGLTPVHWKAALLSWTGWAFDFYDLVLFTFLATQIGHALSLSTLELSYVLGASLLASAAGGIAFGRLCDRIGRKRVLELTILTYSVGTLLSGLSWSLASLLVFRALTGLGAGGEWAAGQIYLGEIVPPRWRGRLGAFVQSGGAVGFALAAVVGSYLPPLIGWRLCFAISVVPALLIIPSRRRLPESDLWLRTGARRAARVGLRTLMSPPIRRTFVLALVMTTADMTAYWLTFSWFPLFLRELGMTVARSALWVVWTQVGILAGCATYGIVADRVGRRPAFTVYCTLMAVGLMSISLWWDAIRMNPSLILAAMFLVGFGTGNFAGYGPFFSELFPTELRGAALGTAFNVARGVQCISPVLVTLLAAQHGLGRGIALAAAFSLATGACAWLFPETRGMTLDLNLPT